MANIHVEKSSLLPRKTFLSIIRNIEPTINNLEVTCHRSERSLLREWAVHKFLYQLGLFRSHTESVDLNYPQAWWVRVAYLLVGAPILIFMR